MGLLSGLAGLGLKDLENADIFEDKKKTAAKSATAVKEVLVVEEKDIVYDKQCKCPVCDKISPSKIMKTGKAKLIGMDDDLRPRYEGIDSIKYDVYVCTYCGYAALSKFYSGLLSSQAKFIKENIMGKVRMQDYGPEVYTYPQAIERYKLALACAVVKRAKASEKAYICLKSGWLLRGYAEELEKKPNSKININEIRAEEEEYLLNAYNGFTEARMSEAFPMCGMDETTIDFLLAELAFHLKKFDVASKLVADILTSSSAPVRIKDKARDLKEKILEAIKVSKQIPKINL